MDEIRIFHTHPYIAISIIYTGNGFILLLFSLRLYSRNVSFYCLLFTHLHRFRFSIHSYIYPLGNKHFFIYTRTEKNVAIKNRFLFHLTVYHKCCCLHFRFTFYRPQTEKINTKYTFQTEFIICYFSFAIFDTIN